MKVFLSSGLIMLISANVFADNVYLDSFEGGNYIINQNDVVYPLAGDNINIMDFVHIENHGTINANLIAMDDFVVRINNMGNINGTVNATNIIQFINSENGVNSFDVNATNFSVVVDGINPGIGFDHGINLNQLKNLNANSFNITNSAIIIDDYMDWQNWNANVSLSQDGVTTLIINDSSTVVSGQPINHVTNIANIAIILKDLDDLYTIDLDGNGAVVLNLISESNYSNVNQIDENASNILNDMQLNNVMSFDELQNAMNLSYRFNPSILMRPVRMINNFNLANSVFNDSESGGGVKPFYIFSKDTNSFGTRLYINNKYKDFSFNIGFNFNHFNYENEFNNFSGFVYGGDIKAKENIDNFWVNGLIGASMISFKTDSIYVDGNIKNNPYGYYVYSGIDGGYDYDMFANFTVTPFMGTTFEKFGVMNFADSDANVRIGGNAKYSFITDGIKYEYSVSGIINNDADLVGMLKAGFVSVADSLGVTLGLDAIKSKDYTAYKLSVDAKLVF